MGLNRIYPTCRVPQIVYIAHNDIHFHKKRIRDRFQVDSVRNDVGANRLLMYDRKGKFCLVPCLGKLSFFYTTLAGDEYIGTFSLKPIFINLQLLQYIRGNSLIDLNILNVIKLQKLISKNKVKFTYHEYIIC